MKIKFKSGASNKVDVLKPFIIEAVKNYKKPIYGLSAGFSPELTLYKILNKTKWDITQQG